MLFNLLDYHVQMDNQQVILYYKGPFDANILANISRYLQDTFSADPKVGRRLFAAFIEMAQNVAYYSCEKNMLADRHTQEQRGVGTFAIYEHEDTLTLISGNVIENDKIVPLIDRCETINQLDRDGLRELKRKWRTQGAVEGHPSGNIGLVQIALKSENPLHVEMVEIDADHSFFILSTNMTKEEMSNAEEA